MNEYSAKYIDWSGVLAMTDEEAYQHALADEANPPLTVQQLTRMRPAPNPREIRRRLGMTQEQFAREFQIAVGTLRDWEQDVFVPDSMAKAYLRVIAHDPEAILRALQASSETSLDRGTPRAP